jgi:hypothetical protein
MFKIIKRDHHDDHGIYTYSDFIIKKRKRFLFWLHWSAIEIDCGEYFDYITFETYHEAKNFIERNIMPHEVIETEMSCI